MTNTEPYDSTSDTKQHIDTVRFYLGCFVEDLNLRALNHDASKLASPEKEAYDILTPRLAGLTYGSDEYRASLSELKPTLQHHYENNSHHPEHYLFWRCPLCAGIFDEASAPLLSTVVEKIRLCPRCCEHGTIMEAALEPASGLFGFDLLDLVEMLCDWKAASLRHADGDIQKSIEHNVGRFSLDPQIASILRNTVMRMGLAERRR